MVSNQVLGRAWRSIDVPGVAWTQVEKALGRLAYPCHTHARKRSDKEDL
jgi:hypothetical protein